MMLTLLGLAILLIECAFTVALVMLLLALTVGPWVLCFMIIRQHLKGRQP